MCLAFLQGFLATMFPWRGKRTRKANKVAMVVWWDFVCVQEKSCATSSPSSFSFSSSSYPKKANVISCTSYWTYHLWNWKRSRKSKDFFGYIDFHWLVYSPCDWDTYGVKNRGWFCCILMEFELGRRIHGIWW
jgi:hypothetical protein